MTGFNSKRAMSRDKFQGEDMSDLDWEIQELYIEGFSAKTIAVMLNCDIELVLGKLEAMGVEDGKEDTLSPFSTVNS